MKLCLTMTYVEILAKEINEKWYVLKQLMKDVSKADNETQKLFIENFMPKKNPLEQDINVSNFKDIVLKHLESKRVSLDNVDEEEVKKVKERINAYSEMRR